MVGFGQEWPLAAPAGPRTARNQQLSMVGSSGLSSQALATILGPFPATFPDMGPCPLSDILTPLPFDLFGFLVTRQTAMPIRTAPRFCLGGCGRFENLLYGCRDPSLSMCRALGLFLTHKQCVVETGHLGQQEGRGDQLVDRIENHTPRLVTPEGVGGLDAALSVHIMEGNQFELVLPTALGSHNLFI